MRGSLLASASLIAGSLLLLTGCPNQTAETADPIVEDSGVTVPSASAGSSEPVAAETPANNTSTSSSSGGGSTEPQVQNPPVTQNPEPPPFLGFSDEDLQMLLDNYLKAGGGDINGDGIVNQIDLGILLQSYVPKNP